MKTLVIAPHPDDEVLGCGGTMLRRVAEGGTVGWMILTDMRAFPGVTPERLQQREEEIEQVRTGLGLPAENVFKLGLPTTALDTVGVSRLVERFSAIFTAFQPEEVLTPHFGDVHSDHRVTFDAVVACTKWFRYPSVRRIMTYETLSETDSIIDPTRMYQPNVFVDIGPYLNRKVELMQIYRSEMGEFPFPRSAIAIRALAQLRGAQSGFDAAEGFTLLRERCA